MGQLLLVKHAAPQIDEHLSASRWTLSPAAQHQCARLAKRLAPYRPDALFASREPKALETATLLGSPLSLSVTLWPGLQENDRTGLPFFAASEVLAAQMQEFFSRPTERVIGIESADEAHARFEQAVRQVLAATSADTPIVVTHGTVISLLVGRANRVSSYSLWRELEFTSFVVVSTAAFELQAVVHPPPA